MNIADALAPGSRLFLDSAPVIYYVERHPHYLSLVDVLFDALDDETIEAVTSPVTLAECLILPLRVGNTLCGENMSQSLPMALASNFGL